MAGCGEVLFVGGDAEAVYLTVGEVDLTCTDAGESFPETVGGTTASADPDSGGNSVDYTQDGQGE